MSQGNVLKITALQMTSSTNLAQNLEDAALLIEQAAGDGAQMLVLPEYFCLMGQHDTDKLRLQESHGNGKIQDWMAEQALKNCIWLIGGTIPVKSHQPEKAFSRSYVFDPDGKAQSWYDKIHLFDVSVNDETGSYLESKATQAGSATQVFETPWGKFGLATCYDLRFPEMFRIMQEQGAKAFLIPAAFTYPTGKAHWEILLKARAVENLAFVVASAQTGVHENGRRTWGHSAVISPWGETLGCLTEGVGAVFAELKFDSQQKIRNEFPVLSHTRL